MRRPSETPPAAGRHGAEADRVERRPRAPRASALRPDLDSLLTEADRRGYHWYQYRSVRDRQDWVLVGILRYVGAGAGVADVYVLVDQRTAHGYRAPERPGHELLHPTKIWRWVGSEPAGTLEGLLHLPAPDWGDCSSAHLIDPPAPTGVPADMYMARMSRGRPSSWRR